MADEPQILQYRNPLSEPSRHLTLKESDGEVRVTFGVMPKWVYLAQIIWPLLAAGFCIVEPLVIIHSYWTLLHTMTPVLSPEGRLIFRQVLFDQLSSLVIGGGFWLAIGIYELRKYSRWGRVPKMLTATKSELTQSWLGIWRMRQRRWPASDITAVNLRPIWGNLTWWRTVAMLSIERIEGSNRHFRLSSCDPHQPTHIAERLREILSPRHADTTPLPQDI